MDLSCTWLDLARSGVATWVDHPEDFNGTAVVVLPALGYSFTTGYLTARAIGERLATNGCLVARPHYSGTGDSAHDHPTWDGADGLLRTLPLVAQHLRATASVERLIVVGLRGGALLALAQAEAVGADQVVGIATPASGQRLMRALNLLTEDPPPTEQTPQGCLSIGGYVLGPEAVHGMAAIDPASWSSAPARVTLVDRAESAAPRRLAERLRGLGSETEVVEVDNVEAFLDRPAEECDVPEDVVAAVARAVLGQDGTDADPRPGRVLREQPSVPLPWHDGVVREQAVQVSDHRLVGVWTRPGKAGAEDGDVVAPPLVIFLNSGSDPHSGPGRTWTTYGRELALAGVESLRVDFRGWGDSPHGPPELTVRPYDMHAFEDTAVLARWAIEQGRTPIFSGLCWGPWVALWVARTEPVGGVVGINAEMFWQLGDQSDALVEQSHRRREQEIAWIKEQAALGRWDREDAAGLRPAAGEWLDRLDEIGLPAYLVFSEGDASWEYLHDRLGRRVAEVTAHGRIVVREVPDIDHGMSRVWLRPRIVAELLAGVDHVMRVRGLDESAARPEPRQDQAASSTTCGSGRNRTVRRPRTSSRSDTAPPVSRA